MKLIRTIAKFTDNIKSKKSQPISQGALLNENIKNINTINGMRKGKNTNLFLNFNIKTSPISGEIIDMAGRLPHQHPRQPGRHPRP